MDDFTCKCGKDLLTEFNGNEDDIVLYGGLCYDCAEDEWTEADPIGFALAREGFDD